MSLVVPFSPLQHQLKLQQMHSIFPNNNELYYCNLLHDESIQKTNNKKYIIDVLVE